MSRLPPPRTCHPSTSLGALDGRSSDPAAEDILCGPPHTLRGDRFDPAFREVL